MVGPKLYFLVSLCLLVTPAALQEQEERGRRAKCRNPRGRQGDVYTEDCTQFTCTRMRGRRGKWIDRPNLEACCFQDGQGYAMGEVVDVTVSNCTETTMVCERSEGSMASIVAYSACTCFQEILTEVEENGENIEEIIDLLNAPAPSNGGGDPPTSSSSFPTNPPTSSSFYIPGTYYLSGDGGEFQSPGYPGGYANGLHETWNIEVAPDMKVKLTFQSFDLEGGYCGDPSDYSSDYPLYYKRKSRDVSQKHYDSPAARCENYICPYDYVQISFGSFEENYCASTMPSPIISSGNTMTVLFSTDGSVTRSGFMVIWEAVDDDGMGSTVSTTKTTTPSIPSITATPTPMMGNQGVLQSPNYPDFYDNNMYKVWKIEVASGMKVRLTFQSFDFESGYCGDPYSTPVFRRKNRDVSQKQYDSPAARCENYICYDYVQISYDSVEEQYCGSEILPSPITSTGNTMTVVFKTDGSITYTGYMATWEAVEA